MTGDLCVRSKTFVSPTTWLTFHDNREKSPDELRQVVSDVFGKISPVFGKKDVGAEDSERTTTRLLDFLRFVKYKPEVDELTMRNGWASGEPEVIYPALKWVLNNLPRCERYAYVGYFMNDVAVPADLSMDQEVSELRETCRALQMMFMNTHKEMEEARKNSKDPVKLKERIAELEQEREQLTSRIAMTKGKVASKVEDKSALSEISELAISLRKEQEAEMELQQQLNDQYDRKEQADIKYQRTAVRLREIRASLASGSSAALLTQLAEEVAANRSLLSEKLPAELEMKNGRLMSVRNVLRSPLQNDSDLHEQTNQVNMLNARVRELEDRRAQLLGARDGDAQLRQQAQVAKSVAAKRDAMFAKRDKLAARKAQLNSEYETSATRTEDNKSKVLKSEDMQAKFEAVKAKLSKYKRLKPVLDEINMEAAVLARTEALLEDQQRRVMGDVAEEEKRAGIAGFAEAQETLEEVSKAKGAIDQEKGNDLEEISRLVAEINTKIKDRKGKLQPQIKALREMRQKFQELEAKHEEKKKAYEAALDGYKNKREKLESEVRSLKQQVGGDEGKFHYLNVIGTLTDAHIRRITSPQESAAIKADYTKRSEETENRTKELKVRQKEVKENFSSNLDQIELLKDLYRLMDTKLRSSRKLMGDATMGESNIGAANVLSM